MRADGIAPKPRSALIRRRTSEAVEGATDSEFGDFMNKALTKNGETTTNEEAIFSALVHHGISSRGDSTPLSKLEERMEKHSRILERKVGYASEEKVAKFALRDLVRNNLISKDEATQLYSKSFAAAQLDSDPDTLSDGIGGESVGASGSIPSVVASIETKVSTLTSSSQALQIRSLGEGTRISTLESMTSLADLAARAVFGTGTTSTGTPLDGPNVGFLFKPVSDTQGKLVILAPESLTGKVNGIILRDSQGNLVEQGSSGGVGNGGREHFRFSRPGGSYPKNISVEIQIEGGASKTYSIPDPSQRYD